MTKWIAIAVIVLAASGGWWYALGNRMDVDVVEVKKGPISALIDEQGKTRLPQTYLITMPYAGRIEPIGLIEGAKVRKGQQVAGIVPIDLELALDVAKAAVESLQASVTENQDVTVEKTGKLQSEEFVKSMRKSVEAASEQLKISEKKVNVASSQLDRYQGLRKTNAASQEELERKEIEEVESHVQQEQNRLILRSMEALEMATAMMPTMIQQYIKRKDLTAKVYEEQKQEALAKLRQAEENDRRGRMLSPVDGVVLKRAVTNERYLAAGEVLLEIGHMEDLEVEAEVLSQDVVKVKQGDPVEIYGPAIGAVPAKGKVDRIYPAGFTKVSSLGVEQQRVIVIVKFNAADLARVLKDQLGVDYRVRVRIYTAEKSDALVVPRSATFRDADGAWQVMAVRNGRAVRTPIEVGLKNDSQMEVLKGLQPGDIVVRAPESRLTDGARVRVK